VEPETRYARSDELHIAYQVVGAGPRDLVLVPPFVSHVEHYWEDPLVSRFLGRLASFSRLILFDKRGTGLSDRVPPDRLPTLEQRMDDVRAVLDAVGSARAALFGPSEGGPMSALFAATYPRRTSALVLYGTFASTIRDAAYPWAMDPEERRKVIEAIPDHWGQGTYADLLAPSLTGDERFRSWWARLERLGASPGAAMALRRMNGQIDVRPTLPAIRVPTLVLHRTGDLDTSIEEGRYLAAHIPGARFVDLPGADHLPWAGDQDALLDEVEEFLTGTRPAAEPDRVLATVLFTDIVASTERAAELGDRRWRDLLFSHHAIVRRELERFRGRQVKTVGDGVLATFDGPARAVRCACAIRDGVRGLGLSLRAGLHTGECELIGDDVGVSPSTSARGWRPRHGPVRCWSPARSRTWWSAPASSSPTGAATGSRGCPAAGGCSPSNARSEVPDPRAACGAPDGLARRQPANRVIRSGVSCPIRPGPPGAGLHQPRRPPAGTEPTLPGTTPPRPGAGATVIWPPCRRRRPSWPRTAPGTRPRQRPRWGRSVRGRWCG
jgi:pimeloyl-ACP methyl ester carboxylesterase